MKYVIVTGGVISGVGKGIVSSSVGLLMQGLGFNVTAIKIDPYLNLDAGTISPLDHGEVFVLEDGGEVDMDLGNYERFMNISLTKDHNLTTGKIYREVLERERMGGYLGETVQIIPHLTREIMEWIKRVAEIPVDGNTPEICVVEVGGTVGDIESAPFIEALRQFQFEIKRSDLLFIHVALIPESNGGEQKTKPTQSSVMYLRGLGLNPDIIVGRCTNILKRETKHKISMFCHVHPEYIFSTPDCPSSYHVPLTLKQQGLADIICKRLELDNIRVSPCSSVMEKWEEFVRGYDTAFESVRIVIVGKYTNHVDAYTSICQALQHASVAKKRTLKLGFVESMDLENDDEVTFSRAMELLKNADGIVVPGGFGERGTDGMIGACRYARENRVPFLGICFGFQLAAVEVFRNVVGLDANSTELDPNTAHPVVASIQELSRTYLGGTMRLGKIECEFVKSGHGLSSYKTQMISERHRHRYELNPKYIPDLEKAGLMVVCQDVNKYRAEILELEGHPFFVGVQFHPEFKSRPLNPGPIFISFIAASIHASSSRFE